MLRRSAVIVALLVALGAGLAPQDAWAHAALVRADPAPGAKLDLAPGAIRLTFSERPEVSLSDIGVLDAGGGAHDSGRAEPVAGDPLSLSVPTVPVMHLKLAGSAVNPPYTLSASTPLRNATGHPVPSLGPATGNLLNSATFSQPKLGMASQNVKFTQSAQVDLGVDGVFGTHDVPGNYMDAGHLGSSHYAKQGDILELTVQNVTSAHHPFHMHGFSIQPIKLTRPANPTYTWTYPEFRDNVDIPGLYTLTFRVKLHPRPMADGKTGGGALGRWLFHCHIFFHATNGMLSELVVLPANGNERPDVNVNGSATKVKRGKRATIRGTYQDPDGDGVKLKASIGSVRKLGNGKYRWQYRTRRGDHKQVVYVTATDSKGLKGQIPFYLTFKR